MARVFIGLGSNLGDRAATIADALARLAELPRSRLVKVSSIVETDPVGPTGQPKFLNAVAELRTEIEPEPLLRELLRIESDLGRVRAERHGPRTLDLDLLLYDDRVIKSRDLTLPHPEMARRGFVLGPLAEIAPDAVEPVSGLTAAELLARWRAG